MEQVIHAEPEAIEIALRGGGQVGAVCTIAAVPDSIATEPGWKIAGQPVAEVIGQMSNRSPAREVFLGLSLTRLDP